MVVALNLNQLQNKKNHACVSRPIEIVLPPIIRRNIQPSLKLIYMSICIYTRITFFNSVFFSFGR
jgi:hypothetical protein